MVDWSDVGLMLRAHRPVAWRPGTGRESGTLGYKGNGVEADSSLAARRVGRSLATRCCALLVCALAFIGTGCASVINGKSQDVKVKTTPAGATATANGMITQTTPCVFDLRREDNHVIEIKQEGYKTHRILIESTEGGAIFGNLLLGGLVGVIVDSSSGASKVLDPDEIDVVMETGSGMVIHERPKPESQPTEEGSKRRRDDATGM